VTKLSKLVLASMLVTLPCLAEPASAKSVRCSPEPTPNTICKSKDLTSLDNVMKTALKRARFDSPKKLKEINHEQTRWVGRRNLCGTEVACIRKRYNEQIGFLESFFNN